MRRELHAFPEPAYREEKTAARIVAELTRLGIPCRTGVAGTGIVADLGPADDTSIPCVALRADMDGVALDEATGLAFSSTNPGVMHACGHDGHVAMLLGAAELLREVRLPGRVRLLFQPAEESGNGAEKMVAEGVLDGVCLVFGGHIDVSIATGTLAVDSGLICSFTDPFTITISGRDGHAARPHEAVDSVVAAAQLVVNIQTLVSRESDPHSPAVVTVGRIRAGTTHNVIAGSGVIDGTVRTTNPETRRHIMQGLERMVRGCAVASGAEITLRFQAGLPAVINDARAAEIAGRAAADVVGVKRVVSQGRPSLGGEDFAFYLERVPGCLVRFGARKEREPNGRAHSAAFDFDEGVLGIGAAWLARVALLGLRRTNGKDGGDE